MLFRSNVLRALSLAWVATSTTTATLLDLEEVNYADINQPDFALKGYMSYPQDGDEDVPLPAVVILPVSLYNAWN